MSEDVVPRARGRPSHGEGKRLPVLVRLSPEVLDHFMALSGHKWGTTLNEVLLEFVRAMAQECSTPPPVGP